jgi:hypothetical protein
MANECHECVIGLYHHYENSELVTVGELEEQIADAIMHNIMLESDPLLKECKYLRKKEWTLADYGDKRKNTNLTRFDYCPECGKAIDWAGIRRMKDGK